MTQQQLADKIGRERSYIAHVEKGETDMQLSSFVRITNALGITLNFDYCSVEEIFSPKPSIPLRMQS